VSEPEFEPVFAGLSEAEIERLAAEAEAGYDLDKLVPRRKHQNAAPPVRFRFGPLEEVSAVKVDRNALSEPGVHTWAVALIYRIDDPERALDDMELGAENFLGVGSSIRCLKCHRPYRTPADAGRCFYG
jgi:hypothetical protein